MRDRITNFEIMVMLAVMRLDEDAYGIPIAREVTYRSADRSVSVASVYAALERLETKGWVRKTLGEATPVRGGKAKAYFGATAAGLHAVREHRRTSIRFWDSIPLLK